MEKSKASGNVERVVLMGNRQLAIDVYKQISRSSVELLVVLNPSDRSKDELPSLLREVTADKNVRWIQPPSVSSRETFGILSDFKPDLIVSCSYERIIPQSVINLASVGCFNFHFAMLPKNRGCLPVVWGMASQEKVGVTLHQMDSGIDTGKIVSQVEVDYSEGWTAKDLYDACTTTAIRLFEQFWSDLSQGSIPSSRPQVDANATYHTFRFPFDRWIPWQLNAEKVAAVINSLTFLPHPSPRTNLNGLELCLLGPAMSSSTPLPIGNVLVMDEDVYIGCGSGSISLKHVRKGSEADAAVTYLQTGDVLSSPVVPEYSP